MIYVHSCSISLRRSLSHSLHNYLLEADILFRRRINFSILTFTIFNNLMILIFSLVLEKKKKIMIFHIKDSANSESFWISRIVRCKIIFGCQDTVLEPKLYRTLEKFHFQGLKMLVLHLSTLWIFHLVNIGVTKYFL